MAWGRGGGGRARAHCHDVAVHISSASPSFAGLVKASGGWSFLKRGCCEIEEVSRIRWCDHVVVIVSFPWRSVITGSSVCCAIFSLPTIVSFRGSHISWWSWLRWSAHAAPVVSKELREKAVLGANILKDGSDPQILPDRFFFPSVFPRPSLSQRKISAADPFLYTEAACPANNA